MNEVIKVKLNLNNITTVDNIGNTKSNYKLTGKNNNIQYISKDNFKRIHADKNIDLLIDNHSIAVYIYTQKAFDKFLKNSEITFTYEDNTEAVYKMSDYINLSNLTSKSVVQMNRVIMCNSISEKIHILHYNKFVYEYKLIIFNGDIQ